MAGYDNAYSRWVASLKIVLPIAALVLLSTLFLFSRNIDPDRAIPYAQVDVEQIAREQRITGATYSGVTEDGTSFRISAAQARPDLGNLNRMYATELQAALDLTDGTRVTIAAGDGTIDTGEGTAMLQGGVRLETDTGYVFETETLEGRLDASRLVSDQPVKVKTPLGDLEAGAMELTRRENGPDPFLLVFKNRVKLVYLPSG